MTMIWVFFCSWVLVMLVVGLWEWVIKPNTKIYEPTKKILNLLKAGKRFYVRDQNEDDDVGDELFDFVVVDKISKNKTYFWYNFLTDGYHCEGNLDWMNRNEANKFGNSARRIYRENKKVDKMFKETEKGLIDDIRRKKAIFEYK